MIATKAEINLDQDREVAIVVDLKKIRNTRYMSQDSIDVLEKMILEEPSKNMD